MVSHGFPPWVICRFMPPQRVVEVTRCSTKKKSKVGWYP